MDNFLPSWPIQEGMLIVGRKFRIVIKDTYFLRKVKNEIQSFLTYSDKWLVCDWQSDELEDLRELLFATKKPS